MSEFVTNCDKFEKENGVNETVNVVAMWFDPMDGYADK